MILRRLSQHLREQNWTAITIEFVLLVVGVFLGIQVANWNEERANDERSAWFTQRLDDDLRRAAWNYRFLLEYYQDVLANAERTVDALDGVAKLDDEALLISAYRATQYLGVLESRSTYDELVSTGTLALIRDHRLRGVATAVFNDDIFETIAQEGMASRYRAAFRMLMPNAVQRTLAARCGDRAPTVGDYASIANPLDYACSTGLSAPQIADAVGRLRDDRSLVLLLRLRIADIETRMGDLTSFNLGIYDDLRAYVEESSP